MLDWAIPASVADATRLGVIRICHTSLYILIHITLKYVSSCAPAFVFMSE